MEKRFTQKNICLVLMGLLLLSIIPLLLIARFDHPAADDFSYGLETARIWRETGSPAQTLAAAAEVVKHTYQTWQGSFAAIFMMALQPAVFSEGLYPLAVILLLLFFAAANLFFWKVTLMDFGGANRWQCGIVWSFMTFLAIQFMISPVEGLYWYNGAMYYTGFHSLALLAFALVLKTLGTRRVPLYTAIAALLGGVIGGGNLVTALCLTVVLGLFSAHRLLVAKKHWLPGLLVLLALCAGLLINAAAPGNAIRQENFTSMHPLIAILQSFWMGLLFLFVHFRPIAWFGLIALIPFIYTLAENSPFFFRLPGAATALLFCGYASSFTPNLYAMSSYGMPRIVNVNQYLGLLLLFWTAFYWCGWIARHVPGNDKNTRKAKKPSPFKLQITTMLVGCFLIGCVIAAVDNPNSIACISAVRSLATGEARSYHEQNLERLALYQNDTEKNPRFAAFTVKPYLLFFEDLTENPDDWKSVASAGFYNKESAALLADANMEDIPNL